MVEIRSSFPSRVDDFYAASTPPRVIQEKAEGETKKAHLTAAAGLGVSALCAAGALHGILTGDIPQLHIVALVVGEMSAGSAALTNFGYFTKRAEKWRMIGTEVRNRRENMGIAEIGSTTRIPEQGEIPRLSRR